MPEEDQCRNGPAAGRRRRPPPPPPDPVQLLTNRRPLRRDRVLLTAQSAGRSVVFQVHDDGDGVPKRFETAHLAALRTRRPRPRSRRPRARSGPSYGPRHGRSPRRIHPLLPIEAAGGACFQFTIPFHNPRRPTAIQPRRLQPTPGPLSSMRALGRLPRTSDPYQPSSGGDEGAGPEGDVSARRASGLPRASSGGHQGCGHRPSVGCDRRRAQGEPCHCPRGPEGSGSGVVWS